MTLGEGFALIAIALFLSGWGWLMLSTSRDYQDPEDQ